MLGKRSLSLCYGLYFSLVLVLGVERGWHRVPSLFKFLRWRSLRKNNVCPVRLPGREYCVGRGCKSAARRVPSVQAQVPSELSSQPSSPHPHWREAIQMSLLSNALCQARQFEQTRAKSSSRTCSSS